MNFKDFYDLTIGKIITWIKEFIHMLPNFIIAILIIVLGFYISRWIRRKSKNIIQSILKIEIISNLFSTLIYTISLGIFLMMVLRILNLDQALGAALAGAGIVGIALAFAFQDIAANFVAGIVLSIRLPIRIGHLIQVKEHTGTVQKINLRDTVIRTFHGQDVIIPNKVLFDSPITNYSISKKRCIDLEVGVSYNGDLENIKSITLEALKTIENRLDEQGALFYYQEFQDSAVSLFIRLWLKETNQAFFLETRSQAIMLIHETYKANNIHIPFPIRTIDFKEPQHNISKVLK